MEDYQSSSYDSLSIVSLNSSSSRSFVTDDNLPTLRLDVKKSFPCIPPLNKSSGGSNSSGDLGKVDEKATNHHRHGLGQKRMPLTYALEFPVGTNIGLQFKEMSINQVEFGMDNMLEDDSNTIMRLKGVEKSTKLNRARSYSDSNAVLKNKQPSLKTSAFMGARVAKNDTHRQRTKTETSKSSSKLFGNILKSLESPLTPTTKKKSIRVSTTTTTTTATTPKNVASIRCKNDQHAILVCDFKGFDTSMNIRPTLGARLIAINDEFLLNSTKKWTLDDVIETITKYNSSSQLPKDEQMEDGNHQRANIKETLKLTFRNDPLTKDLKDELYCDNNSNDMSQNESSVTDHASVNEAPLTDSLSTAATIVNIPIQKYSSRLKTEDGDKAANNQVTNEQTKEEMPAFSPKTPNPRDMPNLPIKSPTKGIDKFFGMFEKNIWNINFDTNDSSKKTKNYPFIQSGLTKEEKEKKNAFLLKRKKLQYKDKITKPEKEPQLINDTKKEHSAELI